MYFQTFNRLESEIEESERKIIEFRHIPFEDRTDKDDSRFHFHYTRARLNKLGLQQVVSSSKKMVDREQVIQDQLKTVSASLESEWILFQEKQLSHLYFASIFKWGSLGGNSFSLREDAILDGIHHQRKQAESHESCFPL